MFTLPMGKLSICNKVRYLWVNLHKQNRLRAISNIKRSFTFQIIIESSLPFQKNTTKWNMSGPSVQTKEKHHSGKWYFENCLTSGQWCTYRAGQNKKSLVGIQLLIWSTFLFYYNFRHLRVLIPGPAGSRSKWRLAHWHTNTQTSSHSRLLVYIKVGKKRLSLAVRMLRQIWHLKYV